MTPEVQKEVERLAYEYDIPVEDFSDRLYWPGISMHQKLSESFIQEFADRVDWPGISMYQQLSESFIREFSDRVDWPGISVCQHLSEPFIREFSDRVYWPGISACQTLSEPFIREFADRVYWPGISMHQKLSESFIREFLDRVDWDCVSECQKLREDFIQEFQDKLDVDIQVRKHHQVIDKEASVQEYANKHDLEYKDGVLTAYRNHDRWGRGSFNGATFYEPGQYYQDWHCDLDADVEASFGLGIWPKGNTKVLVKVEDWGVAVKRGNGKARVWGFEVVG